MVSATIRQVVDDALTIIGEVPGAGVQTYSEDRMMRDAIRSFNMLFKKFPWHQYREWFQLTLDGTLGIINADSLGNVIDFEDFISVHRENESAQLPILPFNKNPFTLGSGTRVMYWTGLPATDDNYAERKLQFWPKTATGIVNVHARVYPQPDVPWDWADSMHLDRDMLAWGTAFMTLASDDLNVNAANMTKNMMEMKFKDIMNAFGDHPIPIDGSGEIPSQWTER